MEKIPADPDVVYLACKYTGRVIWKNSAGESLTVHADGQSITVKKNEGHPENVYTCTLKNDVSEETSNPVQKKDLFNGKTVIYFNITWYRGEIQNNFSFKQRWDAPTVQKLYLHSQVLGIRSNIRNR